MRKDGTCGDPPATIQACDTASEAGAVCEPLETRLGDHVLGTWATGAPAVPAAWISRHLAEWEHVFQKGMGAGEKAFSV